MFKVPLSGTRDAKHDGTRYRRSDPRSTRQRLDMRMEFAAWTLGRSTYRETAFLARDGT
jgi:hypothetical protein